MNDTAAKVFLQISTGPCNCDSFPPGMVCIIQYNKHRVSEQGNKICDIKNNSLSIKNNSLLKIFIGYPKKTKILYYKLISYKNI